MLRVDAWPTLEDPLLVCAFAGWVDAGYAGATALGALVDQLEGARPFAEIDLGDLVDLQQTRPTVELRDGGMRAIEWPRIEIVAGHAGRDVVVVRGPEPALRWPAVADELEAFASRLGVREAATLGGIPALVSHRRPARVLATAVSRSLAQEVGPLRDDYAGPTGFQTVVQHRLGRAGVAAVGLWAEVPQYVSGSTAPPAARALLARIVELYRLEVDLGPFDAPGEAWRSRIEEGLADRPDVARLVDQLDAASTGGPAEVGEADLPTGDEIASEIERFLREER